MKLFFESIWCSLLSAVLAISITPSHPSQRPSEDAYARHDVNRSDPIFTKNVFVLRGKTIELFPIDEGAPLPGAVWRKNGQLLEHHRKRKPDGKGREIAIIEHADFGDNGVYTYEVVDGKSEETYAIKLEVLSPPYFTFQPRDVVTIETKTVEIGCKVNGVPKPVIKWMKNSAELKDDRHEITSSGSLRIRNVLMSDRGVEYTCQATNEYGEVKAKARLVVRRRTRIVDYPMDHEISAGDTSEWLWCSAKSDPALPLRVRWLRNNRSIDIDEEPRIIQQADNTLLIAKTNSLDSGTYTCVASTDLDEVRAKATLLVHGEPSPATILGVDCGSNEAQISWVPANESWWPVVRYSIQYNTSFVPDIWETVARRIPAADRSYAIKMSPWVNYTFRVITWNEHGPSEPSSPSSVCTTLPDVPYRNPDNVEGKGDHSTNLVIKWTVMPQIEHHAPKFMYRVYYKRDIPGEKWIVKDIQDWRTNEIKIDSNQTSYQEYKIKVVAVNERGESRETPKEVVGYSGEDAPLEAPGNVSFKKTPNGLFLLSWTKAPDKSIRSELRNYKISIWPEKEENTPMTATIAANETQFLFNPFPYNSTFYATIKACNRK